VLLAGTLLTTLASAAVSDPPTTVYVVRHAEKATEPRRNPGLTEAGSERAEALADELADAGLTAIITSQFARTRATAAPTARVTGLDPVVIHYRNRDFEANGRAIAAVIAERPAGSVILVVGHSDTVPWIIRALGGPTMGQLCEATEYGSIFELVVSRETETLMKRTPYGTPDPPLPPECLAPSP
jgi:broad specificity phosphatase PhoE